MAGSVQIHVIFDHFPKIIKKLDTMGNAVIAKAALDIEAGAKSRAPVDTGFLKNSIQAAKVGDLHWRVTVGADYGIYVEHGTSRMAAQPYMRPAIDAVRPAFIAAMRQVCKP